MLSRLWAYDRMFLFPAKTNLAAGIRAFSTPNIENTLSYIIKFSLFVCLFLSMLVRNRLPNHAYHGDEAFAGDSVGLGLGQRLNFI